MIDVRADKVKPSLRIPFQFRADPVALDRLKLPRTARLLFTLILDNAKSKGWRTRLSNTTFARILECTRMTVIRSLATLEAAGLIRREYSHGGRVRTGVVVTWEGVQHSAQPPSPGGATSSRRGAQHSCNPNQGLPLAGEGNQRGASAPGGGAAPEERGRDLTPAEFRAARELMRRGQFSDEALARLMGLSVPDEAPRPEPPKAPETPVDAAAKGDRRSTGPDPARHATPAVGRREAIAAKPRPEPGPLLKNEEQSHSHAPSRPPLPCPAPAVPPALGVKPDSLRIPQGGGGFGQGWQSMPPIPQSSGVRPRPVDRRASARPGPSRPCS